MKERERDREGEIRRECVREEERERVREREREEGVREGRQQIVDDTEKTAVVQAVSLKVCFLAYNTTILQFDSQ